MSRKEADLLVVSQGFDTLRYSTHRFLKPVSLEPFAALKGRLSEGLAPDECGLQETKIESVGLSTAARVSKDLSKPWATIARDIVVLSP
jgi:hypothetical protein